MFLNNQAGRSWVRRGGVGNKNQLEQLGFRIRSPTPKDRNNDFDSPPHLIIKK